MALRENVIIKTATTDLRGELYVGVDGLPELVVSHEAHESYGVYYPAHTEHFRPATFPNAWRLEQIAGEYSCLLNEWREIEAVQLRIRVFEDAAQREAEAEEQFAACSEAVANDLLQLADVRHVSDEHDDRDRAQQREIDNRIAQEIEERRTDETPR